MTHMCPECGNQIEEAFQDICEKCNFDFGSTIDCPYKISNNCVFSGARCAISGLNFEDCRVYLAQSGIAGGI